MYDVTTAKLFLLDMDGTFYLDDTLLPGALEFLALCRATGRQFGVVMILTVLFLQRGIVGTIRYHKQQKMIRDQHAGGKNDGKEAAV